MSWDERLREAAYTSPRGERFVFLYEDVSRSVDKKTAGFTFPDADGTYVQDLGRSSYRYPLRIIFSGDDHDLQANAFDDALLEKGIGKLEHPMYGSIDVVPFGTLTRRDDLKTAANQTIYEIVFWETIGLVYPTTQNDPGDQVVGVVQEFVVASAEEFLNNVQLDGAIEKSRFKNIYLNLLNRTEVVLKSIADVQDDVSRKFNTVSNSINGSIDILIADPLSLAFQTNILIQTPALILSQIQARLDAYRSLAGTIINGNTPTTVNELRTDDLYASGYVSASILSVVNNTFLSKPEALSAAEDILDQFKLVNTWRDDNFRNLAQIDTGEGYQKLQDAVALAAGFLVEISFTLKQERIITLDRNRNIVELVAELYGEVDDQLDFFISSNALTPSEIIELPRGKSIVYYR